MTARVDPYAELAAARVAVDLAELDRVRQARADLAAWEAGPRSAPPPRAPLGYSAEAWEASFGVVEMPAQLAEAWAKFAASPEGQAGQELARRNWSLT